MMCGDDQVVLRVVSGPSSGGSFSSINTAAVITKNIDTATALPELVGPHAHIKFEVQQGHLQVS